MNKLEHKYPQGKGFLWWIEKTIELYSLKRPPCYRFWWERGVWARLRSRITHRLCCRRDLPHKPGEMVSASSLPQFELGALTEEFEKWKA